MVQEDVVRAFILVNIIWIYYVKGGNTRIHSGREASWTAGERVIEKLQEKRIKIPVIVCSSMNMKVSGAYGNIWYSELRDWEKELKDLVGKI